LTEVQKRALGRFVRQPELKVAVGVVTYNGDAEQLSRCLRSAASAQHLLVWDNGAPSAPPTDFAAGQLVHRGGDGNLGFGPAHNRLMQEAFSAGSDLYVCVNPDGFLHPEALERVARVVEARQGAVLVECVQFPVDHPKKVDLASLRTAWASGAALAIPRRVYETIGGFDESFFMYCEDVDLSWRARAQGFEVVLCPNAYFVHEVTNRALSDHSLRMIAEAGARLARKWGSRVFERWALTQGPRAQPPKGEVGCVPAAWRDVAEFDHGFSFSETRWS
jgi:GT2 family glycosyltransferase